MSASTAHEFRMLAREVFAELGLEVGIYPDHAEDSSGRKYGFWNIAAICNPEPRTVWRSLIAAHLQRLLTGFDGPDPFDIVPPAEIPARTFARLYEESALPPLDGHPHREFAPGVIEMLALDLPDTVATFRHENARTFGGWEALRQQGIANLRALKVERLETLTPPGGGSFSALIGSSFYTASRAILLPSLATELTGKRVRGEFGWLMSVPNRHQVAWHVIEDSSVIGAVNGMASFTAAGYSDSPGPVSPHVYWWNGTGYEQLTEVSDEGTVRIRVGQGFQAVLESVMKG
ncbi:hypothetical protein N2K95_14775 [Arthrobacter zhaoxinii]|uniref:Uncharacterized protein n=1 Tax=Arthrobacter zhaoxinii TaxID=2964616 RepID=A0ABY5YP60_9MICC|nr:hypothetical protein [Arthrobacter zhaoxinii]UWX96880.1 hypothetical protein N2K95_14775 [Arthrobacter zhaoxinii]